jgi:hypothetical protein
VRLLLVLEPVKERAEEVNPSSSRMLTQSSMSCSAVDYVLYIYLIKSHYYYNLVVTNITLYVSDFN